MKLPYIFIFVISSVISLSSCSQIQKNKNKAVNKKQSIVDTSNTAIIRFDQTGNWPFNNSDTPAYLSEKEILQVDSMLSNCITNYNSNLRKKLRSDYGIDNKRNYKRQYVAVMNDKGEKLVWVNCFCSTLDNKWKKEILLVHDGGNCYFNLKINLKTKKCFNFSVNGYA